MPLRSPWWLLGPAAASFRPQVGETISSELRNPDAGIFFAFERACGLAHPCPKLYQAGGAGQGTTRPRTPLRARMHLRAYVASCEKWQLFTAVFGDLLCGRFKRSRGENFAREWGHAVLRMACKTFLHRGEGCKEAPRPQARAPTRPSVPAAAPAPP